MADSISTRLYEPEMIGDVAGLFAAEYGRPQLAEAARLTAVFESSAQQRAVRVVALRSKAIVGFQSYLDWPVRIAGSLSETTPTFQSGNSIVSSDARGEGIFGKLLRFDCDELAKSTKIGFPVAASFPGFIRAGWTNPFDLTWWALPSLKPIAHNRQAESYGTPQGILSFEGSEHFRAWRRDCRLGMPNSIDLPINGGSGYAEVRIEHRTIPYIRKSIRVGVVGAIRADSTGATTNSSGLEEAVRFLRAQKTAMVTIAVNSLSREQANICRSVGFKETGRRIRFIAKDYGHLLGLGWDRWNVFRGDIDTW